MNLSIWILPLLLVSGMLAAQDQQSLPIIRNTALLPVKWQEAEPIDRRVSSLIESALPSFIEESRKFRQINQKLVNTLIEDENGQRELIDQFELDAYLELSIESSNDIQTWKFSMLSPIYELYLSETERVPLEWLDQSNEAQIQDRLKKLVYRLLNRYPIDVYVTSKQGKFVTLSAGKKQELFEGDKLAFYSYIVSKRHPIDNQWIKYDKKSLAEAIIIESKDNSSIAQLIRLDIPDSIQVGVGTKINKIASRRLFAQTDNEEQIFQNNKIIPLKTSEKTITPSIPKPPVNLPVEQKLAANTLPSKEQIQPNDEASVSPPEVPEENASSELHLFDTNLTSWITDELDETFLIGKIQSWSYKQNSISANSLPPAWLFNSFAARGSVRWSDTTYSEFEPELNLGLTSSGNYYGVALNVNWLQKIPYIGFLHSSVDGVEFGAQSRLFTKSITGENFGGIDALSISPTGRIYGKYHLVDAAQTLDYKLGVDLNILAVGQLGLGGFKKSISNLFGIKIFGEVILRRGENNWDLGGSLEIDQQNLSNSNGSTSKQSLSVGLIARRVLP